MFSPTVNRERLRDFLEHHIHNRRFILGRRPNLKVVTATMAILEPLFRLAERGEYQPISPSDDWFELSSLAILALTNEPPAEIVPVSLAQPLRRRPRWLTDTALQRCLEQSLKQTFRVNLQDCFRELASNLKNLPCGETWGQFVADFGRVLDDNLTFALGEAVGRSLQILCQDSFREELEDAFVDAVFCYVGLVLTGQKQLAGRLEPLIKLLPKAYPLGQKSDEPEVWLVLFA